MQLDIFDGRGGIGEEGVLMGRGTANDSFYVALARFEQDDAITTQKAGFVLAIAPRADQMIARSIDWLHRAAANLNGNGIAGIDVEIDFIVARTFGKVIIGYESLTRADIADDGKAGVMRAGAVAEPLFVDADSACNAAQCIAARLRDLALDVFVEAGRVDLRAAGQFRGTPAPDRKSITIRYSRPGPARMLMRSSSRTYMVAAKAGAPRPSTRMAATVRPITSIL